VPGLFNNFRESLCWPKKNFFHNLYISKVYILYEHIMQQQPNSTLFVLTLKIISV